MLPRVALWLVVLTAGALADDDTESIDWVGAFSAEPKTLDAAGFDKVRFDWAGTHDVYRLPDEAAFDGCDFSSASLVGDASPAIADRANAVDYFACSVGSHCASGQKLAVHWVAAGDDSVEDGAGRAAPPVNMRLLILVVIAVACFGVAGGAAWKH